MKLKPLFDRVLIKPEIENERKTQSGIILAASTQEKPAMGTVVAVGEGGMVDGKEVKMVLEVNDKVVFSKFVGTEIKIDGIEYIVLKQVDVLGVIKE